MGIFFRNKKISLETNKISLDKNTVKEDVYRRNK